MNEQGQHANNGMCGALWERKTMKPLPLSGREEVIGKNSEYIPR